MNVLASLTDAYLGEHFDPATVGRAVDYVGAVRDVELNTLSAGSVTATALVQGTRAEPYEVQLHAEVAGGARGDGWLFTVCTCPVHSLCKHGAALALALRRGFVTEQATSQWRTSLGRLADELRREQPPDVEPLSMALEVTFEPARRRSWSSGGARILLRPLRPGAKQRWIKTGADWSDVPVLAGRRQLVPAQAAALVALQTALQVNHAYYAGGAGADLRDFGPQAVRLLREAADAGVELVCRKPLREVVLHEQPVRMVAEVTAAERGTTTEVRIGIDDGATVWRGDEVVAVGLPVAHVVGVLDDTGLLTLAPCETPITASGRSLLEAEPLSVPVADREALHDELRSLLGLMPVRSPDGSAEVPERLRPELVLVVVWHSSTKATLEWTWEYSHGRRTHRFARDERPDTTGVRDRAAEREIASRLPAGMLDRTDLFDGDALAFALNDLPYLREIDDVRVVEQDAPDFREATDAPEIGFELVEPTSDDEHPDHTDWLDLEVTVTVEGESIPLPDVLGALTHDAEFLVLSSGLYIATDRPEFDRLREVVAAAGELRERDGDRIGVGRGDLGLWAQLAETGLVDAQAAEWVARAQALRDLVDIPRPEPTGLATELRSYQREGFWWLAFLWQHGLGGILADDMGLGKTLQVLATITHARAERPDDGPFLVVAPTSVVTAWADEASRHAPGLRIGVVGRRDDDIARIAADSDVVVSTYTLVRLGEDAYAEVRWSGLILDEAQQVKNHQSKTYSAVRRIVAPFRLCVTGTPFENRLMELWSLLSIAVPGLYPWPKQFASLVARPVEKAGDATALERFRRRIKPFVLRRTKDLVAADLPEKQEQVLPVVLEERHRRIYDAHLAKERQRLLGLLDDFDRNRVAIFTALTRLRQLALDPALVDPEHDRVGSAKLDVLLEHLAELTAEGHRALVFSQFTSFLGRVRSRLDEAGIATTYLDGSTTDRAGVIDRFRSGEASVFLISLKAGGVGLTLTEADYVFVLDPWWNPAAEAQAVDRAHRIGQTSHVHVYRLVATDTIEEKVMELKERKAELFAQVIDGEGAVSTSISAEDIRDLFE
ncbi:MAG: DEAD/DEAH box helicase [Nocardioidaceae bacterium]|nr:DEAD/DEAH box helicase [Nocardioidaceae bacterium]MCL2614019.1 DEAD/DEAH box helicase [Nocardioidaceae bacterium]